MLTYRTPQEFGTRFAGGIAGESVSAISEPGAYLRARGEAFSHSMSAGRFLSLSAAIDRHRVEPDKIKVPALLIGSESDQLVPPSQIEELAKRYAGPVTFHLLPSLHGHDMFLKDADKLAGLIGPFLRLNP
jgi:homoserine O-acetyltransferase